MVDFKNLNEILTGENKGKVLQSLNISLGNYCRNKIITGKDLFNGFNVDFKKLNEVNFEQEAKLFLKSYMLKNNCELKQALNCNIDELLNSLTGNIQFHTLEKLLCMYKKEELNSLLELYSFYTPYFKISYDFTNVYNDINSEHPDQILPISNQLENNVQQFSNEIGVGKDNVVVDTQNKLDKYTLLPSLEMCDLNNEDDVNNSLAIEIKDFLLQNEKRILILSEGTGYGKSTAINKIIVDYYKDNSFQNRNKIFYVCDTNKNVNDEFEKLERIKIACPNIKTLKVKSNSDSVIDNFESFKKLPKRFTDLNEYKILNGNLKEYHDKKNKKGFEEILKIIKESIETNERNFRSEVKKIIKGEEGFKKATDKYDFIKNHKVLSAITDVYTNFFVPESDVIFVNINSFTTVIDTLVETFNLNCEENFLNNSIICFDESDALYRKILDIIIDKQKPQNSLYRFLLEVIDKFKKPELEIDDVNINKRIKNVIETFEKIKINPELIWIDANEIKEKHFLFVTEDTKKIIDSGKEYYIIHNKGHNHSIIISKDKVPETADYQIDYNERLGELYELYKNILYIFFLISDYKFNKINKKAQFKEVAKEVIKDYFFYDPDKIEILVQILEEYHSNDINDSKELTGEKYLSSFMVSDVTMSTEFSETVDIKAYDVSDNPEKFLYNLLQKNAKIILSSATANDLSKIDNFDLDWEKLKKEIYEIPEKSKRLFKKYREIHDKNIDELNISVGIYDCTYIDEYEDSLRLLLGNECVDDFNQNFFTEKESNRKHRKEQYFILFKDIIEKVKNGSHLNLELTQFKIDKQECIENVFKKISEYFLDEYDKHVYIYTADSNTSEEKFKLFQEKVKNQVNVKNYAFLLINETAGGKAANFIVNVDIKKKDLIFLNDIDAFPDNSDDDVVNANVDLTGLYVGEYTNILPIFDEDENVTGWKNKLRAIISARTLEMSNCIDDILFKSIIRNILSNKKNPFKKSEKEIERVLAAVAYKKCIQNFGRLNRSNIKLKNVFVTIHSENINKIKKYNLSDFYPKDFETQPAITEKIFGHIANFTSSASERIHDAYSNELRMPIKVHKDLFYDLVINKARNNSDINAANEYNKFRQTFKSLSITREEYSELNMPGYTRCFYIKSPEKCNVLGEYSYDGYASSASHHSVDPLYTEKIISRIGKKGEYDNAVNLLNVIPNDSIKEQLEKEFDFSFDYSKNKILCPKGIEIFQGNMGEAIAKIGLSKLNNDFEILPAELTERVDFIWNYCEKKYFVDAKYFSFHEEHLDDISSNLERFEEKLNSISNFYKCKCDILIINTKNVEGIYRDMQYNCKKGRIITIPKIYDTAGNLSSEILYNIIQKTIV